MVIMIIMKIIQYVYIYIHISIHIYVVQKFGFLSTRGGLFAPGSSWTFWTVARSVLMTSICTISD